AAIQRAPGATPIVLPLRSPPTIVPVVCVPWPLLSYGDSCSPYGSNQLIASLPRYFGASSKCVPSTPVSKDPTTTPVPSYAGFNAHTSGARTWAMFQAGSARDEEPASFGVGRGGGGTLRSGRTSRTSSRAA